MLDYYWDFSFLPEYYPVLCKGIFVTIELSFLSIIFATLLGILLGVLVVVSNRMFRCIIILIIDIIRSIPLLVFILWVYYLFPMIGLKLDPFIPALVAFIINGSVFIGDVVRGGLEGVPKGAALAGKALGMSRTVILRRIILPEVFREIFPSLTMLYISILKFSSLASVVSVSEITHVGEGIIASTYKPLEVYTIISGVYLILVLPLTLLTRRLETSKYFKRRTV